MDYLEIHSLYHHGIKGQKWGIRRYQNDDGTLTAEGKAHYGVSDKDIKTGKKYEGSLDKHKYRIPNTNNKEDLIAILKYDRIKGNKGQSYFNSTGGIQLIHHYADKSGKIALTYARVPGFGDVYVAGPGTFTDEDLKKWFKKSPNKNEIAHSEFVIMEEENIDDELEHHGVKGQRWGIRRYQNDDGTLTAEGRKRYGVDNIADMSKEQRKLYEQDRKEALNAAKEDIKRQGLKTNYAISSGNKNLNRLNRGAELIKSKYGQITLDDFAADEQKRASRVAVGVSLVSILATVSVSAYAINKLST